MRCARLPRHHTYTHYTIFPYAIHTITGDTRLPHRPSAWEQRNLCPCHACQAHPNSCQAHPNACQTHPNPSAPLPSWSSAWKERPVCSCRAHPNSCQTHPNPSAPLPSWSSAWQERPVCSEVRPSFPLSQLLQWQKQPQFQQENSYLHCGRHAAAQARGQSNR